MFFDVERCSKIILGKIQDSINRKDLQQEEKCVSTFVITQQAMAMPCNADLSLQNCPAAKIVKFSLYKINVKNFTLVSGQMLIDNFIPRLPLRLFP